MGMALRYYLSLVVFVAFAIKDCSTQIISKELRLGYCYATFEKMGDYVFYNDAFMAVDDTYYPAANQETLEIVVEPAQEVWEKRKIRLDCDLPDPEDCYALCLRTIPPVTLMMVTDTLQVSFVKLEQNQWTEKEKIEWVEVPCGEMITQNMIIKICQRLKEEGYYSGMCIRNFTAKIKEALLRFQTDYHLPIGLIDDEALDILGIPMTISE